MAQSTPRTIIYKTVGRCQIKLDLYLPPNPGSKSVPVLLRLHGGGLLQGNRGGVPPHILRGIDKYNFALVSADYRLAPQVGVAEILGDVLDCLSFMRDDLKAHIQDPKLLDTTRIAVLGSSAGGYLALLAGIYAKVKPDVILAIYPITNPRGDFFMKKQPHPEGNIERHVVASYLDKEAGAASGTEVDSSRNKMYYWMLQEAALADLLGVQEGDERHIVAAAVKKQGQGLPPMYLVHGDADKLVGVEQSDEVVAALKDAGAVYEYERPAGLDHLFDRDPSVELDGMYQFLQKFI